MIKFILKCHNKHEFESWFSSSKEYEKLIKKKLIECIYCKSTNIKKSIMAPKVIKSKSNLEKSNYYNKEIKNIKKDLLRIRDFVEKNFEYVGENFSKKVKDIYYDKKKEKKYLWHYNAQGKKRIRRRGNRTCNYPLD